MNYVSIGGLGFNFSLARGNFLNICIISAGSSRDLFELFTFESKNINFITYVAIDVSYLKF